MLCIYEKLAVLYQILSKEVTIATNSYYRDISMEQKLYSTSIYEIADKNEFLIEENKINTLDWVEQEG